MDLADLVDLVARHRLEGLEYRRRLAALVAQSRLAGLARQSHLVILEIHEVQQAPVDLGDPVDQR